MSQSKRVEQPNTTFRFQAPGAPVIVVTRGAPHLVKGVE